MENQSLKDFLLKKFPPNVESLENAYESRFWKECTLETAQEISNKVIELYLAGY